MEGKNAIAVSAGRYLLTYLRGGYELWLRSGETVLFYQRFDRPIYTPRWRRMGRLLSRPQRWEIRRR